MVKHLLVKYGGLSTYRQARPEFLGLVLGEMTSVGIWAIIGMVTGAITSYRIFLSSVMGYQR